jgi:hypothetical protein
MSERNGSGAAGTGTAEIPVVRAAGSTAATAESAPVPPLPDTGPGATGEAEAGPAVEPAPTPQATTPVTVRPAPRLPRRGPLTVMGPWAPVAGAALGLLFGVVSVLLLAGSAPAANCSPTRSG